MDSGCFLKDKGLCHDTHRPYLLLWVREFLEFAHGHPGYSFDQTLDLFLTGIGERPEIQPWQVRQAGDGVVRA